MRHQRISQEGLSSCRCSTTSPVDQETMKKNASRMLNFFLFVQERFGIGQWSFLGPRSEKKWYSTYIDRPRGEWDRIAEKMMIKYGESKHPVFRATSPLSRGQLRSKGHGKLSIHYCADLETIKTVFRTVISVNQLSIYEAVSDLCEEYKACHVRAGNFVLAGQSDPLFVPTSSLTETPTPSTDDPVQEDLLQKVSRTSGKALTTKSCD